MNLELHPLTDRWLDAAVELDRLALGGMWTRSGYQREIDSPNSELLILTSDSVNLPIALGCMWAILDEAHITLLAVHPDYQRQGLGQAMLLALLMAARRRNLSWATLEVRASNQVAIALYAKFGFTEVGKRPKYYPDNGEDALILWRRGLQSDEFAQELAVWKQQISDRLARSNWSQTVFS
ncbi:ribosomal protein S18-alanine N-acetyltransferase [Microcoleus sp. FACHB-1515]|uniref:ribosomal protein S18-alanine N-acetyltransferase n=1 Tax=Cyanophyceae TaxID=3028117 RepID=UPI00168656F2|nr:ribosomal protein S18-alanine N-acetyltransferase [Microcoleus sp. FACHB-1515]MBD2091870.1 ribosomal protein S18-alanine N-acetyltransferase [Microcoleus sp. FACHB-1515]